MRLFSYKLTTDSGFAPNPFFGELTLATCKPQIRLHKKIGDWIAGFTSKRLCGDQVGNERLIFLMNVTDKLPLSIYWSEPRFLVKRPGGSSPNQDLVDRPTPHVLHQGDNVYYFKGQLAYQMPNPNHPEHFMEHDVSGKYALCSTLFYYFGSKPVTLPHEFKPSIPRAQSSHGSRTHNEELARLFIEHIQVNYPRGVNSAPTKWPPNDISWDQHLNSQQ
jgi:hypothetical protein